MQTVFIGEVGGLLKKIEFHVLLVNANDDDISVVQFWSTRMGRLRNKKDSLTIQKYWILIWSPLSDASYRENEARPIRTGISHPAVSSSSRRHQDVPLRV